MKNIKNDLSYTTPIDIFFKIGYKIVDDSRYIVIMDVELKIYRFYDVHNEFVLPLY